MTKFHFLKNNRRGSILILSIWTLSLLTTIAVYIGLNIRQKVVLLSRLENRSQLQYLAAAGAKKAISALLYDLQRNNFVYTSSGKNYRHNNVGLFKNITLADEGTAEVAYHYDDEFSQTSEKYYGFMDEEGKLNINLANRNELKKLFFQLISVDEDEALELADAIIDWRQIGKSQVTGFYSDDYYANLKDPYQPKNADFELIDELSLVKGFTEQKIEKLKPYITIYGEGIVNVNTAPGPVLVALGLNSDITDKLLAVRRGPDGLEHTIDDYIFEHVHDIATEMLEFTELEVGEIKQIDSLGEADKLKTNSLYYSIESQGKLKGKEEILTVSCVYNIWENKIEYWREK